MRRGVKYFASGSRICSLGDDMPRMGEGSMRRIQVQNAARLAAALLLCALACQAEHKPQGQPLVQTDLQPTARIDVAPLGYTPPASFYLTYRMSSATLGFFDKDHLLFTFRVGGLLKRAPDAHADDDDQQIRALLLDVGTGKVLKQTEWRMHDRGAYLWPYTDGRFLIRIRNSLYLTGESLELEPYLTFDAGLREVEISPDRSLTVLETNDTDKPRTMASSLRPPGTARPVNVMILPSGEKSPIARSQAEGISLLPLMDRALLDVLEGAVPGFWVLRHVPFSGEPNALTEMKSNCRPSAQPVSARVALMVGCYGDGDTRPVLAVSMDGQRLWQSRWANRYVWGWFDYAENGSRFAYESVEVNRPIGAFDALYAEDITDQMVGVYDTESGKLVLVKDASPVLTAGQNVALSRDGRRFAILRQGAVEIYDLPPVEPPQPQKPELVAKKKGSR
jgi:hypothetical protein